MTVYNDYRFIVMNTVHGHLLDSWFVEESMLFPKPCCLFLPFFITYAKQSLTYEHF